jgi:subtilisin family serine protease
MAETTLESASPPVNRSAGALVVFLLLALFFPFCSFIYHFTLWSMEQSAIASGSLSSLAWFGLIGLGMQAIILSGLTYPLWRFTNDDRFKPVYAGWFAASLLSFPALTLRLLGPNNDQAGFLLQILICVVAAFIIGQVRGIKLDWRAGRVPSALFLAALGVLPFVMYGALGSPTDALLGLVAGLSFGACAALTMEATTGNKFLDALGIGVALSLLGSALGYDGSQLILLAILPAFAFAAAVVMPSRVGALILSGLLCWAGLVFFDPTELSILLGDIFALASRTVGAAIAAGLGLGILGLAIQLAMGKSGSPSRTMRVLGWVGAGAAWWMVLAAYFLGGNPGFYGDRLFVILKDQADLSSVSQIRDIDERRTAAYQTLTAHANQTQAALRQTFDAFGVEYTPYYLVNAMEVQGGTLVRLYLLTRPEVDRVIPSPRLRPAEPVAALALSGVAEEAPIDVQWNVEMIGADKVWEEFNVRGENIVIGQSDSGVDGNHPELKESYRGLTEGDDYNWFDPWNQKPSPYDDGGHGTHTLGTILGKNGIGIAPAAEWIGCVNLNRNLANPAFYLDCMQFMLAPFPQGGDPFTAGNPTRAADVLNNSWGCPELEGCDPNALLYGADHLRAAGIFVVVSAGNDGPNCNTVNAPLSLYDSVFSVGAIDQFGNMADFSSRGPVIADGSGRIKPDIVAPGVDIYSSTPGGGYGTSSGTSMAGPHVAGAVALLWSADPTLIGDIDRTEQLIIETAQPFTGDTSVGCFEGGVPNDAYGYGMVDVFAAVKAALDK